MCHECYNELNFITNCCTQCALPLPESASGLICGKCLQYPPHFDRSVSLFTYEPPASHLVQGLKFGKRLNLARLLGDMLAIRLDGASALPDCIAPVPLSGRRTRSRGFNQSMEIARPVGRKLGIPLKPALLTRTINTPPQSKLAIKERRRNVRGAFRLNGDNPPRHIAIVDDVVTTGSTVNEIARILKKSGVETVEIWSVARAII